MTLDKHHIILYIVAIGLLGFGIYLVQARHADKLQAQADALKGQAELLQKENDQKQAELKKEIDALQQVLVTRQAVEVKLPAQNATLNASQIADAIIKATGAQPGTVTTNNDLVQLPITLSQQALTALQLVPMLQADKADLTKQLAAEKESHASDLKACKADVTAANAEVVAVKAKSRKNIMKAFGVGVIVGVGIRKVLGF